VLLLLNILLLSIYSKVVIFREVQKRGHEMSIMKGIRKSETEIVKDSSVKYIL